MRRLEGRANFSALDLMRLKSETLEQQPANKASPELTRYLGDALGSIVSKKRERTYVQGSDSLRSCSNQPPYNYFAELKTTFWIAKTVGSRICGFLRSRPHPKTTNALVAQGVEA
jgi:hypothetical protein